MTSDYRPSLVRSFGRHLRAENRSEHTIASYLESLRQAEAFVTGRGRSLVGARREDLEAFLGDLLQRRAPEIVATRYRRPRVLYRWLEEEEEITASPMAWMRPPIVPEQPVPVVPEDGLRQLLAACAGKDFEARRDTAILMFLLDTGARRPSWPTSSSATLTWTWMSRSCSARAAASAPCPTAARRLSRWTAIYAFAPGTRTPISPGCGLAGRRGSTHPGRVCGRRGHPVWLLGSFAVLSLLYRAEVSADPGVVAAEPSAERSSNSADPAPSSADAHRAGAEVLSKRARAERVYASLSANGAPPSSAQLAAAAGLSASYARALVAQFQTQPPTAQHNGRPPSLPVRVERGPEATP